MSAAETATKGSIGPLKKLLAARGKLQGNFYAVLSGKIDEGGLVVTLLSRDPKGGRALSLGKQVRQELAAKQFARGKVVFHKNKLYFEIHQAKSLAAARLKKALRKGMGDADLMKYLKTALVGSVNEEKKDEDVAEEVTLTEEERQEALSDLDDLETRQKAILESGDSLETFLSGLDDDADARKLVREAQDDILVLLKSLETLPKESEKERPQLLQKLAAARLQLLEASAIGQDLDPSQLPKEGEVLDDVLKQLGESAESLLLVDISLEDSETVVEKPKAPKNKGLSSLAAFFRGEKGGGHSTSSPFSQEDRPVGLPGPRRAVPFPPAGFLDKLSASLGKTKGGLFASKLGKQARSDRQKFTAVLAQEENREIGLALALNDLLDTPLASQKRGPRRPTGEQEHPYEKPLQRAIVAVQALLASGGQFTEPADQKALLQAMSVLSRDKQVALLRADALSGKKLYSALYLGAKSGDESQKNLFAGLKSLAQEVSISEALTKDDRSGESAKLLKGTLEHLGKSGVPEKERRAFIDKLAFKMQIRSKQQAHDKDNSDIPAPDTGTDGWRGGLTGRMISTLAETPEVSDESVLKALDMPPGDLMKVLGAAFTGTKPDNSDRGLERREGDFRITRLASQLIDQNAEDSEDWRPLKALMDGLESGALSRNRFSALLAEGTAPTDILRILNEEAGATVTAARTKLTPSLAALKTHRKSRKEALSGLDPSSEAAQKIQEELRRLKEVRDDLRSDRWSPENLKAVQARLGQAAVKELTDALPTLTDGVFTKGYDNKRAQFSVLLDAQADPKILKKGLDKMALVLPTAGRLLKDCAWIYSTAADLVRTATDIRKSDDTFNLKKHPIIILDQTDGGGSSPERVEKWNQNAAYLKELEKQHADVGLTFQHVSMGDINGMIKGSGVERMFDTTGENMAGYGGARNMAFMLGPVILDAVRKGEDIASITPDKLAARIKATAMDKAAPMIFMGDDGDYVAPGMLFSRAAIVGTQEGFNPELIATPRGGRDTTAVSPLAANGAAKTLETEGYDAMVASLFTGNKWESSTKNPGMGCALSAPRFCLSLPTGKEESQLQRTAKPQSFTMAMHLSGDRQARPSDYLKGNLAYTNMTETINSLLPPAILPWNARSAYKEKDLGELMDIASNTDAQKTQQKTFLRKMAIWRKDNGIDGGLLSLDGGQAQKVQKYLDDHPELDAEARDELARMKVVYEDAARQARTVKTFIDKLIQELAPDIEKDEDRIRALEGAVELDPSSISTAIAKIRQELENGWEGQEPVRFDNSNPMIRNFMLICDTVGGGKINELAGLLKP